MSSSSLARGAIRVQGASTHNLKKVSSSFPYRTFIVITGPSGSGKSSLAFDTLFAEGRRRYMESFGAYARQFIKQASRPPVEFIQGMLPSVGLQQKTHSNNPRARVGTTTDIYAYLKLLYTRVGITYSPISGREVKKNTLNDIVTYLQELPPQTKVLLLASLYLPEGRTMEEVLRIEMGKGFTRLLCNGKIFALEDFLTQVEHHTSTSCYIIVDRLVTGASLEEEQFARLADSVKTAFFEGRGTCQVRVMGQEEHRDFSDRFEEDGISFEEPSMMLFSFNNPYGACETCSGIGKSMSIDSKKVIPDPKIPLNQGAVLPFKSPSMLHWQEAMLDACQKEGISIFKPYEALSEEEKAFLWKGKGDFKGIDGFFQWLDSRRHKIQYRILYAGYRGYCACPSCQGSGLRKEVNNVKIDGKSIIDLLFMPIDELYTFFSSLFLPEHQRKVGSILIEEITHKLFYLNQVGLGYLNLNRLTNSLSGGEYQRIRLAKALGSSLVDTLYILDEPSIGLHPRDTHKLVEVLQALRNAGNTVIVVEHEELIMEAADQIIDVGPQAGAFGGELVFQGTYKEILNAPESITGAYLAGKKLIPMPSKRREAKQKISLGPIWEHNLQGIHATFPLGVFTTVTGVSGSGKSTLIQNVLYPSLCRYLGVSLQQKDLGYEIHGDLDNLDGVESVGQASLGKSSRSCPVTYLKAYDHIRKIFSFQPLAIQRHYGASFFSFNVPGGRCEVCLGEGVKHIEMQFMADITMTCESCHGKRFLPEILEVTFQKKNIYDILEMTIDEAIVFFKDYPVITKKMLPMQEVGLGYLGLGQSSSTLSGGEAQRVKLSSYLADETSSLPTFFIFDEPTTGLHFDDIAKLMKAFHALVDRGHTVVVIEHNMDVVKCADWVIDLGPEGGKGGGKIIFEGTPEDMIVQRQGHTAHYLRQKMVQTLGGVPDKI